MKKTVKAGIFLIAIFFAAFSAHTEQTGMVIHGSIRDIETGKPLPAAHIRIVGTRIGTISNENGEYNLELHEVPATIYVSYIGYQYAEKTITVDSPDTLDILLQPRLYTLPPIIVTPGNTAEQIMRKVIKRKQGWQTKLETYKADAYTRINLESKEKIAFISESISVLYWHREKGTKEVTTFKHHTKNIPEKDTIAFARMTPNFYDDDIELFGFNIIGPTHPDALKYYTFKILEYQNMDAKAVYVISVEPKSKFQPLFRGTVAVLDEDYALINLDLEPNEAFIFPPPINHLSFSVKQQFSNFGEDVWLPVDVRVKGQIKIKMGFLLEFPMIKYNQVSRFSNYQINVDLPDSLYKRKKVMQVAVSNKEISVKTTEQRVDFDNEIPETGNAHAEAEPANKTTFGKLSSVVPDTLISEQQSDKTPKADIRAEQDTASLTTKKSQPEPVVPAADSTIMQYTSARQDSLFNLNRNAIPLTEEENEAYATIDSTITMEQAFKPSGALAKLIKEDKPKKKKKKEQSNFSRVFSNLATSGFSPRLWHNRVDGFHLGINYKKRYKKRVRLEINGAYKTYLERWSWGGETELYFSKKQNASVVINANSGTETRQGLENYPIWFSTILTLGGFDDYFDYYWSDRIRTGFRYKIRKRNMVLEANLNIERQNSLKTTVFDALSGKTGHQRINPAMKEGDLHSIALYFGWGEKHNPLTVAGKKGAFLTIEHSSSALLGSDYTYTQYCADFNWRAITYLKRRLFPMTLDIRFTGSASTGTLPIQRFASVDSRFLAWTPFGVFRSLGTRPLEGEHHAAFFLEHNFRTVPFELIGLRSIARKNIGIIIHGAVGRTWISKNRMEQLLYEPRYYNHVISEAGISFNGLFGLLRIDATKRLDKGNYSVGINIARIM